ncbi:hypothetical protein N0V94_007181 [Neodidymelliopsis sp. IMI 364377]|nr:hypothetical protein N0V94_007181 [Neodidymelliopsis sp. IMI 364377]
MRWQDDEIAGYFEDVEAQFDAMVGEGDEDIREEALEQLKDGFDGILKMLLIAHCPRLRDVKFVTQQHDKKSTLGWLKRIIQGSIAYGSYWPPGLSNIRNIAVGVESDTWMSTRNQAIMDPPNDSMLVISTLLRLLRIESVYYNDLSHRGQHDETEFDTPILLPPRSSTVKHIFLDDCGDVSYRFRSALSSAPFALESFTLRAGDSPERFEDADALVNDLADSQGHSLHTLMFYGPYTSSQIHGYRCSVYRNEELNKARNLKTVAISMEDVELDCFYNCDGKEGEMSYDEEKKFWQRWFLESAFPRSLETLILWGKPEGSYLQKSEGHMLEWLEDALVAAIQGRLDSDDEEEEKKEDDKADDSDSDYSDWAEHAGYWNLKAVYLASLESVRSGETWSHSPPRTDKLQFQKLIGMGKQTGVDVDTVTNRTPPQHSHDFPTAPDKWDLRSGPWYARRGEIRDWVFDVYQGRRVPKGCGKCGRCEDCFAEYSEELWRTLD